MEEEHKILQRIAVMETKLENHVALSERVDKLWRWAMVLATVALFLGIGGAYLLEKFDSARMELDKAEEKMQEVQSAMDALKDEELPILMRDSKSVLDRHTTTKKKEIERKFNDQLAQFFGNPVSKTLDQWHTAETHGFMRIQVGGTGGATGRAWVNSRESKKGTSNRTTVSDFNSDLLIVRKDEKFRGEKISGPGNVSLVWYPLSNHLGQ